MHKQGVYTCINSSISLFVDDSWAISVEQSTHNKLPSSQIMIIHFNQVCQCHTRVPTRINSDKTYSRFSPHHRLLELFQPETKHFRLKSSTKSRKTVSPRWRPAYLFPRDDVRRAGPWFRGRNAQKRLEEKRGWYFLTCCLCSIWLFAPKLESRD